MSLISGSISGPISDAKSDPNSKFSSNRYFISYIVIEVMFDSLSALFYSKHVRYILSEGQKAMATLFLYSLLYME